MKSFRSITIASTAVIIASMLLFTQSIQARPTALPPSDNVPGAPLLLDTNTATKTGNLTVSNTIQANSTVTASSSAGGSTICLNGSCRSSWPNLNRPNWSLQTVVSSSPYVYGRHMQIGGFWMARPDGQMLYLNRWPTYGQNGYTGSSQNIGQYSFCSWTRLMKQINWNGSGFYNTATCYSLDYWPR